MGIELDLLYNLLENATSHMSIEEEMKYYIELIEATTVEELKFILRDILEDLGEMHHYCPYCGEPLIPVRHYEVHTELDETPLEPIADYYMCEWCGEEFR